MLISQECTLQSLVMSKRIKECITNNLIGRGKRSNTRQLVQKKARKGRKGDMKQAKQIKKQIIRLQV